MEQCTSLIILIWLIVGIANCFPRRRKNETIWDFHTTGVEIAIDRLIQEYEKEHQKFYEEEIKKDGILEWQELDSKNLTDYCKKYLQYSVPSRSTDRAFGNKITKTLHYKKENTGVTHKVFLVHCKVVNQNRVLSYYIMRASVPNCVYGLISTRKNKKIIFNIINKHCGFEDKPLIVQRSLKRRRRETVSRLHKTTGEPIAEDEDLLQYELEHHEMVKKEREGKTFVEWPHAQLHDNLDNYCYQYMRECVPSRNRASVKGKWKTEKLQYQKLNRFENIYVTVVTCHPHYPMKWHYHFTKAPETNCVYALLRMGHNLHQPMVIIFKHCNLNDQVDQNAISYHHDIVEQNIFPKTEIKEETSNVLETVNFFNKN